MSNRRRLYYSLNEYFRERFNEKVYKITLDAGFSCPTRDGTKSTGGCIYCDEKGSGNGLYAKKIYKKKYRAKKYFIYFQSFTNTYADVKRLKEIYNEAIKCDKGDIVGLIIGTRPDCIDEKKLQLISEYSRSYEVWIEYGLQSIHKKSLEFIKRGHSLDDYVKAIKLTRKFPVKITTHIIVGLPTETRSEMIETGKFLASSYYTDAIKIHSLYIPKTSKLAEVYKKKSFKLLSMEEYAETVADILEILPEDMIIARLTGETGKKDLLAPLWVLEKNNVINKIKEILKKRNSYQGKKFKRFS